MPSLDIKSYVIAGLVVAMLGMWGTYKLEISSLKDNIGNLEDDKDDLMLSLGTCEANNAGLKMDILVVNQEIEEQRVDYESQILIWKNKEPAEKVITKWKTEYVEVNNSKEVDYEVCKYNQSIFDAIDRHGF